MPDLWSNHEPKPIRGLLAGVTGGLFAAWVMNGFQLVWSKASERMQDRKSKNKNHDQHQPANSDNNEDATMKAAANRRRNSGPSARSITKGR